MYSQGRSALNIQRIFYPYGNSAPKHVLENYTGSPELQTNILFLGCGDMRNAFHTVTSCSPDFKDLNIHLNDNHPSIIARNILITHIITASEFNPENIEDLKYIWNVWYSTQWDASTANRFSKDVLVLLTHQWQKHIVVKEDDLAILDSVWKYWVATIANMKPSTCSQILNQRIKYITDFTSIKLQQFQKSSHDDDKSTTSDILNTVIEEMKRRLVLPECPQDNLKKYISEELKNFVNTGNCEPLTEASKAFINPTLLEVQSNRWLVHHLACPYEGYLPIPYSNLNSIAKLNGGKRLLLHCQAVLKDRLVKFRAIKRTVTFFFHVDDCLLLCLFNPDMKKRFQIIDTSNVADHTGLANIILTAQNCLEEGPDSLLLTESMNWQSLKSSVLEYIEAVLCCSLSMIPTLYGLHLANHVRLGNCIPVHILRNAPNPVTLVWKKSSTYSENIRLNMSPALQSALIKLQNLCFLIKEAGLYQQEQCALKMYTPMTFYYIIQSLLSRYTWVQSPPLKSLLQFSLIPPPLQLAWRTQQDWFAGRKVLRFEMSCVPYRSKDSSITNPLMRLVLAPSHLFNRYCSLLAEKTENPLSDIFAGDCHFIDNFQFSAKHTTDQEVEEVSVSFLLAENHCLTDLHLAFIIDISNSIALLPLACLGMFNQTVVITSSPLKIDPRFTVSSYSELQVSSCSEYQDRYELEVISNKPTGNEIYDIAVSSERKPPSDSSHQLCLKLKHNTHVPLNIQLPWPFLVDDIQPTLRFQKTKENSSAKLILKKSLFSPWPSEFENRVKWNFDSLAPWTDGKIFNRNLATHLESQFPIEKLGLIPGDQKPLLAIDEVRLMMRTIISLNVTNGVTVFSIKDGFQQSRSPMFYLRVHPPVRVSPQGAPVLLMTVIDHRLAEKLLSLGKVNKEQSWEYFYDIIINAPGDASPFEMYTYTAKGADLLRYLLRVNSTKIQPTAWQSKNLPKEESWFASFASPLYLDYVHSFTPNAEFDAISAVIRCANCNSMQEEMKRCSRCKMVLYCDAICQKAHWKQHKKICSV